MPSDEAAWDIYATYVGVYNVDAVSTDAASSQMSKTKLGVALW